MESKLIRKNKARLQFLGAYKKLEFDLCERLPSTNRFQKQKFDFQDNFAFLVSLIIFRRVFIKLCQLQFWFVILICAHPFLQQQVEVEIRFKVLAKTQMHA